ncbi:MAG: ribosome maturation factor RimP [Lachnospiraceae bacterium]|nr:ribosome maturation factor RimP [Lachnospiraceae bacterium]
MSRREDIENRTKELLNPILSRLGFMLWDVEYVKEGGDFFLRAFIDKEGGITIDDCVDVSRELSDRLDENDFIEDAYTLEVSSPGLGRTLKSERDFELSIGREVELKTYKPVGGKKEFTGTLKAADKEHITIENEGTLETFARADVAVIKLAIDF